MRNANCVIFHTSLPHSQHAKSEAEASPFYVARHQPSHYSRSTSSDDSAFDYRNKERTKSNAPRFDDSLRRVASAWRRLQEPLKEIITL